VYSLDPLRFPIFLLRLGATTWDQAPASRYLGMTCAQTGSVSVYIVAAATIITITLGGGEVGSHLVGTIPRRETWGTNLGMGSPSTVHFS
jgi:hypothetical protein